MSLPGSIVLGIVQGICEFLPISSSAHLILIRYLFDIQVLSLELEKAFDVALHFGTLLAIVFIFYKDWLILVSNAFSNREDNKDKKMYWYIVAATIPGVLFGLLFEDVIDNLIRNNVLIIALLLAIMGVLIYVVDKWAHSYYKIEKEYDNLGLKDTFLIGVSQALAIIPGFSRSGTTILTARLLGVSRSGATKFSFMLSTPIIFGATISKLDILINNFNINIIVGILTSFIVGVISIKFLLKYVKSNDFSIFAYYRLIIAIIVILKIIL